MTNSQLLAQARSFNPEIGSIHVEHTVYADGDEYLHYIAHVPGGHYFGDSPEDLLATILEDSRKAAA